MVDISKKLDPIKKLIDLGETFTINHDWRYEKTTILSANLKKKSVL